MSEQQAPRRVTKVGNVANEPQLQFSEKGTDFCRFRLAVDVRTQNANGDWEKTGTEFYSVTAFRETAQHVADSIKKGQRVIVMGTPKIEEYEKDGETRTDKVILADEVGPSLRWGTTVFTKDEPERELQPVGAGVGRGAPTPQAPDWEVDF